MMRESQTDFGVREVIDHGYCIGCGVCTVFSNTALVDFNSYGELIADVSRCRDAEITLMDQACPFSNNAPNETKLAQMAFSSEDGAQRVDEIGTFIGLYAGYSKTYRDSGSSGGIASWLLSYLLKTKRVDKVLVVGKGEAGERFFDFTAIDDPAALKATGTSFYYPVSYDHALQVILNTPGRYAITGVPCFHKALRQLKAVNPVIAERVVYQVGIVCGQMKSTFYLDYLSRRAGVDSRPLTACFRRKDTTSRADDYLFECTFENESGDIEVRTVRNRQIGANWAMGLFKPRACDFCDDVFAETADIAVMDAWLDKFVLDGAGTSLIIARTNTINSLLLRGAAEGDLQLESVPKEDIVESQRGGLNHRRAGLRYRLLLDSLRVPVPIKRVSATGAFDIWFKLEQRLRSAIREKSRLAMRKQLVSRTRGLDTYDAEMDTILKAHKWFNRLKTRLHGRSNYSSLNKLDI